MKPVVIAGYARSPFHFAKKGALAKVRPDELAAQVVAALLELVDLGGVHAPCGEALAEPPGALRKTRRDDA